MFERRMLAPAVAACRLHHTPEQRARPTMWCARTRALWGGHACAQALVYSAAQSSAGRPHAAL